MSCRHIFFSIAPLCLPLLAAVPAGQANAATLHVANCNDSGSGSLRSAVATAASGDTIDMSALSCRKINLTSGAIEIAQEYLSLVGGPPGLMKIDAGRRSSVLRHNGTGTLSIKRLDIARGVQTSVDAPLGGCVYSAGNVELANSTVRGCRARGFPGGAREGGGGIFAMGTVTLAYSQVLDSIVHRGSGGAILAVGHLTLSHSRICRNQIHVGSGITASYDGVDARFTTICDNQGDGVFAQDGDMTIADSTITGNVGGTVTWFGHPSGSMSIVNSTISGNTGAVILMDGKSPKSIINSTIAFNNIAPDASTNCDAPGAAVQVAGPEPVLLDSTIIANNVCNGVPAGAIARRPSSTTTLVGANNLIVGGSNMTLPADTINADPHLAALADNDGPTLTHALMQGSPAIDSGNNEAGLEFDQRGKGHPRVQGSQADIGAFEL